MPLGPKHAEIVLLGSKALAGAVERVLIPRRLLHRGVVNERQ